MIYGFGNAERILPNAVQFIHRKGLDQEIYITEINWSSFSAMERVPDYDDLITEIRNNLNHCIAAYNEVEGERNAIITMYHQAQSSRKRLENNVINVQRGEQTFAVVSKRLVQQLQKRLGEAVINQARTIATEYSRYTAHKG